MKTDLLKFLEKYSNGFVYLHSKYFNPFVARDLYEETDETLRNGLTKPEDIKRLIESFEKIKRETSGDY